MTHERPRRCYLIIACVFAISGFQLGPRIAWYPGEVYQVPRTEGVPHLARRATHWRSTRQTAEIAEAASKQSVAEIDAHLEREVKQQTSFVYQMNCQSLAIPCAVCRTHSRNS